MRVAEEFLETLTLSAASTDNRLTNGLPNDYSMVGLLLLVRFRVVVGTATLASLEFGSPLTFIERITVRGQLAGRGLVTVFDMSGRQAWEYSRLFAGAGAMVMPDDFIVDGAVAATYDIQFMIPVPFFVPGASPRGQMMTLLPGNMFKNPLEVVIRRGGAESIGVNAATSTQTFTAYGSASGNPECRVSRLIVKQGPAGAPRVPLLCTKTRQGPFTLTTTLTDGRIGNLNIGNLITRLHLQTGTSETDAGQNGELASGSNTIISRLRLKQNAQVIRDIDFITGHYGTYYDKGITLAGDSLLTSQGAGAQTGGFDNREREGELLLDFIPNGNLDDALNTVNWGNLGQTLILAGDVTGAANQVVEVISEELMRAA